MALNKRLPLASRTLNVLDKLSALITSNLFMGFISESDHLKVPFSDKIFTLN